MRLFTAVDIGPEVRERLVALAATLQPLARLKWSPAPNLHITTKFIGEWPADRLTELTGVLPASLPEPLITVSGIGFFPNDRHPKVLFARVEPSAALTALAHATDAALQRLGIVPEKHPYRPHVTLARIPECTRLHGLRERLDETPPGHFGTFPGSEFSLYESCGGHYTKLQTFPLQVLAR